MLYFLVSNFSVMLGHFPDLNQYLAERINDLAQRHSTVTLRLKSHDILVTTNNLQIEATK